MNCKFIYINFFRLKLMCQHSHTWTIDRRTTGMPFGVALNFVDVCILPIGRLKLHLDRIYKYIFLIIVLFFTFSSTLFFVPTGTESFCIRANVFSSRSFFHFLQLNIVRFGCVMCLSVLHHDLYLVRWFVHFFLLCWRGCVAFVMHCAIITKWMPNAI